MFKLYFNIINYLYTRKFKKICVDSLRKQEEFVVSLCKENQNTVYGKKYSFYSIKNIMDFKENLPLIKYSNIGDYVSQIKEGKKNILTKEDVIYFSITAGTTNTPKFLPLTKTYVGNRSIAWKIWESELFKSVPSSFSIKKKIVTFTSKPTEGISSSGIPYGSVSGKIRSIQPKIVNSLYAVPEEIMYVEDYNLRYYLIALFSIREKVSLIVTPNPSTLIVFSKMIKENFESLLQDFEQNTISKLEGSSIDIDLKEKILKKFSNKKLNLKTFSRLGNLKYDSDKLHSIFKDVSIGTWTSGSVGFYIPQLLHEFGPSINIKEIGFMASEGRFSIPLSENKLGESVLDINSNFFEFIDIDKYEESNPNQKTLDINEVEVGKNYYIIITNGCGLYRYQIDDIVNISGMYKNTPCIKFVQKGKYISSLTGEKVSEWEIIETMKNMDANIKINSFVCMPTHDKEEVIYNFYINMDNDVSEDLINTIAEKIDLNLKKVNIEYEQKRDSMRIGMPKVFMFKKSFFMKLRKSYAKEGKHDYQIKVPKLIVLEKDKKIVKDLIYQEMPKS